MLKAVQPVIPVLLGIILIEAALGIIGAVMGIQMASRDVPSFLIGDRVLRLLSSVSSPASLTCERLINRVGHIRAFGVFAVSASIATLLLARHRQHLRLDAVQGDDRLCHRRRASWSSKSWLNDKASEDNRGRIFAVYMVVSWGAGGLSPLSLNFANTYGDILFEISTILMAAAMIPLALTKVGNPEIGHRESFSIVKLIKASPTGVVCCFASGLLTGGFYSLLPVYIEQIGRTPQELSILIAVGTTAALIVQYPIGYISDHYGRRPVIIGTMAVGAAMALFIGATPDLPFTWLLGLFFVLTAFQSPLYALGVGQTNDYVDRKDFVPRRRRPAVPVGRRRLRRPDPDRLHHGVGRAVRPVLYLGVGFAFVACSRSTACSAAAPRRRRSRATSSPVPNIQNVYGAPELDPRGEFHHPARSPALKELEDADR